MYIYTHTYIYYIYIYIYIYIHTHTHIYIPLTHISNIHCHPKLKETIKKLEIMQ